MDTQSGIHSFLLFIEHAHSCGFQHVDEFSRQGVFCGKMVIYGRIIAYGQISVAGQGHKPYIGVEQLAAADIAIMDAVAGAETTVTEGVTSQHSAQATIR